MQDSSCTSVNIAQAPKRDPNRINENEPYRAPSPRFVAERGSRVPKTVRARLACAFVLFVLFFRAACSVLHAPCCMLDMLHALPLPPPAVGVARSLVVELSSRGSHASRASAVIEALVCE